jgi:hypothetical protein
MEIRHPPALALLYQEEKVMIIPVCAKMKLLFFCKIMLMRQYLQQKAISGGLIQFV